MASLAIQPEMNAARTAENALALYVHWPFCVSKCPYCDFNSHVRDSIDQAAWTGAGVTLGAGFGLGARDAYFSADMAI